MRGGIEILHLDPRHARRGLQTDHLLLRLGIQVFVEFGRLFVVGIAIVVVQVALQRDTRLGLGIASFGAALLLESIAVVPARPVLGPETHAHPAEFVFALAAGHVVAAAVLFNGRVAPRTLLGVCRDPVGRFGIVGALFEPALDQITGGGLMVIEDTSKAESVFTVARHGRHEAVQVFAFDATLNGIHAVGCGTPLEEILVFDICACEELLVPEPQVVRDEQIERAGVHDAFAVITGTLDTCRLALLLDLLRQVLSVTIDTVAMPAFHGKGLQIRCILKADVADESRDDLEAWWSGGAGAQTGRLENLAWTIHVVLNQAFLVPTKMPEQDGCVFFLDIENHVDLVNDLILLALNVVGVQDLEGDCRVLLLLGRNVLL